MKQHSAKIVATTGIIFCMVGLLAIVAFYFFIEKEKDDFHERNLAREKARAQTVMLEGLEQTFKETKAERESLETRILLEENLFSFLANIEALGQMYNVELVTKDLREVSIANNNTFETFVIDVSVTGTYEALMTILSIFETLPYQVTIEKVTLEKQTGGEWSSSYELRITKFKKV